MKMNDTDTQRKKKKKKKKKKSFVYGDTCTRRMRERDSSTGMATPCVYIYISHQSMTLIGIIKSQNPPRAHPGCPVHEAPCVLPNSISNINLSL